MHKESTQSLFQQTLTVIGLTSDAEVLTERLLEQVPEGGIIIRLCAFGLPVEAEETCLKTLRQHGHHCTSSWLENTHESAGLQAQFVTNSVATPIVIDNQLVGHIVEDSAATYCILGGLHAPSELSKIKQTEHVYRQIQQCLTISNIEFENIVRTWFYLDDILSWYDDFNKVRTNIFHKFNIFGKCVPASTGIGASNSKGSALMVDIIAVKPKEQRLVYKEVTSPLQCSAHDYGSSFSRALKITSPEAHELLISGTASIEPEGATIHPTCCESQIRTTLKILDVLLSSQNMSWDNVCRGISYFRHSKDIHLYEKVRKELQIPALALVVTSLTVCRDDLLFELEIDASKPI